MPQRQPLNAVLCASRLESQLLHEGEIIEPEKMNEAKVEFLKTDLDVGITFVKIARTSADPETVSRNQQSARKAYDTVAHFLSTVALTHVERENINTKLERLKSALEYLGETFE